MQALQNLLIDKSWIKKFPPFKTKELWRWRPRLTKWRSQLQICTGFNKNETRPNHRLKQAIKMTLVVSCERLLLWRVTVSSSTSRLTKANRCSHLIFPASTVRKSVLSMSFSSQSVKIWRFSTESSRSLKGQTHRPARTRLVSRMILSLTKS